MLENLDKKTKLKTSILFTVILLVLVLILCGASFLAKHNWNSKLAENVMTVLSESRPEEFSDGQYSVGKISPMKSTISVSSNLFTLVRKGHKDKYALITRMTTYYGPQAAVFLYDESEGVTFEGFACLNSRIEKQIGNKDSDIILNYWIKKAEKIFAAEGITNGGQNE